MNNRTQKVQFRLRGCAYNLSGGQRIFNNGIDMALFQRTHILYVGFFVVVFLHGDFMSRFLAEIIPNSSIYPKYSDSQA